MIDEERYKPIEWPMVRRLLSTLGPYKKQYLFGLALGLVHVTCDMTGPRFIKHIIDFVTNKAPRLRWFPPDLGPVQYLSAIIALWALVAILSFTLQRATILVMTRAGESVQFGIRRRLFSHLQDLSMSYYDKTKLGRIISRCTSDVGAMREVNVWGIWQVAANLTMIVVAAAMLLYTDWRLFLSVCWLGPAIYVANSVYHRGAMGLHQLSRGGWTRVSSTLCENIT